MPSAEPELCQVCDLLLRWLAMHNPVHVCLSSQQVTIIPFPKDERYSCTADDANRIIFLHTSWYDADVAVPGEKEAAVV